MKSKTGLMGLVAASLFSGMWVCAAPAAEEGDAGAAAAVVTAQGFEEAEVVNFPWGWIRWLMNAKVDPKAEMTLGIVHVEPNQSNPYHLHPNSAEYVHVLSGSCEQWADGKWVSMKVGDTLRFPKGVPHMARTGKEACRMMILYDTGSRQMVVVDPKPPVAE